MVSTLPPLKIALIVDSATVPHYTYELVQWAASQPGIALTHIIVQELPPARRMTKIQRVRDIRKREGFKILATRMLWALIVRLEEYRLRHRVTDRHFAPKDVSGMVPNILRVTPEISKSGFVYRYAPADIATIRAQEFDVLLRCGSGILRGDILTAARFGILSFHHGDNRVNRGGPPAFWEVFYHMPTTGFIIQQLTDELDGGHVLFRGSFPTQRYWLANQAHLYERSNYYMKHVLAKIAATHALPMAEEPVLYCDRLFKAPALDAQLQYLLGFVTAKLSHIWSYQLRRRRQRWSVAYTRSGWKNLVMWKGKRIPNPPGRFLADPFVIARDGKDYCFVEDYSYATQRGSISVYELGAEATLLGEVVAEPFHLSFPYMFEHGGTLYMVPESAKNNDIRLYECTEFPLQWRLKRVLMENVSAADSMIFAHGGKWWMFTNINPLGDSDHCSELYAFYTDDPINGAWTAHAANPLIIDPACARNGGILFDAQSIYRVAQRQGFIQYGAGASIRRIAVLDTERYEEHVIRTIEPNFFEGLIGTHHLHSNGTVTAFDFVEHSMLS